MKRSHEKRAQEPTSILEGGAQGDLVTMVGSPTMTNWNDGDSCNQSRTASSHNEEVSVFGIAATDDDRNQSFNSPVGRVIDGRAASSTGTQRQASAVAQGTGHSLGPSNRESGISRPSAGGSAGRQGVAYHPNGNTGGGWWPPYYDYRNWKPPVTPNPITMHLPPLRRDDPQSKADLARGLRINFYQVADPLLLASWTSFFRDQYLMTNGELQQQEGATGGAISPPDTTCRVGSFVLRLNQFQLLESEAFKRLFRQYPLTLTPAFERDCYKEIINHFTKNPPYDGPFFNTPQWQNYMWNCVGLKCMVDYKRCEYLAQYTKKIQLCIEPFLNEEVRKSSPTNTPARPEEGGGTVSGEDIIQHILEAANSGKRSPESYKRASSFFDFIRGNQLISLDGRSGIPDTVGTLEAPPLPPEAGLAVAASGSKGNEEGEAFILEVFRCSVEAEIKCNGQQQQQQCQTSQGGGESMTVGQDLATWHANSPPKVAAAGRPSHGNNNPKRAQLGARFVDHIAWNKGKALKLCKLLKQQLEEADYPDRSVLPDLDSDLYRRLSRGVSSGSSSQGSISTKSTGEGAPRLRQPGSSKRPNEESAAAVAAAADTAGTTGSGPDSDNGHNNKDRKVKKQRTTRSGSKKETNKGDDQEHKEKKDHQNPRQKRVSRPSFPRRVLRPRKNSKK